MGGTTNTEREKLDGQLTWLERWIVFAGFAVAVGVAIEIGPKVLNREIDNEVIGGAIVILGVAIEVILTFVAAQTTSRVQQIANSHVAAANERAAHAFDRAAKAEKEAAEANLARARIEASLQQRTITEEQVEKLRGALKDFLGSECFISIIVANPRLSEPGWFAWHLEQALRTLGLNAVHVAENQLRVTGQGLYVVATPDDECQVFGKAIAEGLRLIGFDETDWLSFAAEEIKEEYSWKLPLHLRGPSNRGVAVVVMEKPVYDPRRSASPPHP